MGHVGDPGAALPVPPPVPQPCAAAREREQQAPVSAVPWHVPEGALLTDRRFQRYGGVGGPYRIEPRPRLDELAPLRQIARPADG